MCLLEQWDLGDTVLFLVTGNPIVFIMQFLADPPLFSRSSSCYLSPDVL